METLSEKARKLKNEYQKNWKRKNPDKVKKYIANYWERKAKEYTVEMQIHDLRAEGLSQRQIAKRLNISVGTVNNYLNKQ
jgi:DNA-binding NarL/FixJ family response regulator